MHNKLLSTLALSTLSVAMLACGQPSAALSPAPASDVSAASSELARPQPERPICVTCILAVGDAGTADDDLLTMEIHGDYVGAIDAVSFVAYFPATKQILQFDQSVVDDLNDTMTAQTDLALDVDGIQRGLLVFDIGTETYYEPVRIF